MKNPRKALFIQLRRIGDILMCTPSVRAFKKAHSDCRLDFLTEIPAVLQGNPHLDNIIAVDSSREFAPIYQYKLIRTIRQAGYDLVVDFLANPRSAWYSYLSAAPVRLSYGFRHRRWAYNHVPERSDKATYSALDKLRLLEAIEIPSDGPRLEFYPGESDREEARKIIASGSGKPLVTLSPVSRRALKRWPLEKFARLADMISQKYGAVVVILAGPGEEKYGQEVVSRMSCPALIPKLTSLGVLGAIFENASLHIGNDNGPKHIAVACGAPTVTIFGPYNPIDWTYPDSTRHQWLSPVNFGENCAGKNRRSLGECIATISVDDVMKTVDSLVSSIPDFTRAVKRA